MEPSFELFDHTADMGIRVRAPSLAGLLKPAADGLHAAIGELVPGPNVGTYDVHLVGGSAAELLRDFLTELLYRFERRRQMAVSIRSDAFDDQGLRATVEFRSIDEERSAYHREVKAVTYHELAIRPIAGGYEATMIVDI